MKLYIKLFLIVFIGILAISGLSGILQIRRETQFFKEESQRAAIILGQVLADEISDEWKNSGISKVREILSKAGNADPKVRFRWVWFDAAQDAADRPEVDVSQLFANHAGSVHVFEKPDASGGMRIYYYFPMPLSTARHGGLELSQSLSSITEYTHNTLVYYVIMSVLLILAIGSILAMGSFWLLAKPLHRVIQRTREIHSGKLEGRLNLHHRDEIGELATSIDKMSEQILRNRAKLQKETKARIEALEQLRHADRLRSVGRLASGIAHELGTPINVISGRAGLIATDEAASAEIVGSAETIRGQCRRMTSIIRQLLDFARRGTPKSVACDLNQIIAQTAMLIKPLARKRRVMIEYGQKDHPMIVQADPAQLEQVLTNLLTNAMQAMPNGGGVRVDVSAIQAQRPDQPQEKEKKYHVIRVQDEGIGITPEDLNHIFDPFFTTKDTGEGTGLGLSIVYGIVQEHGGWIAATSESGQGSTFSVYLPAGEKA